MNRHTFTSEEGFRKLASHGAQKEGKINRFEFHRAIKAENFNFNAPQVDFLFKLLDMNRDGYIDMGEWLGRVHEDGSN